MTLSILGLGLVSPAGARARDHVFFPRAGAPQPAPTPFVLEDGSAVPVGLCPWIGAIDDVAARLVALARAAVEEALAAVPAGERARLRLPLLLCAPAPRPGLDEPALARVAAQIGAAVPAALVERVGGAAGAFAALERLLAPAQGQAPAAAILVGVDSFVSAAALGERARRPPSPWLPRPVPPSEGAGALLVAAPAEARRLGVPVLGEIAASRHAPGRSTDDDDEVVDGAAMTALLGALPAPAPIRSVFGQGRVDLLRSREWEWAVARAAARFHPEYFGPCLEAEIGGVGAAAGVMNLAYGVASLHHGAAPAEALGAGTLVAWAISRDGTRGIACGQANLGRPPGTLLALAGAARARRVEREALAEGGAVAGEGEGELDALEDLDALDEGAALPEDEAALPAEPTRDIEPMRAALPEEAAAAPPVRVDPERVRPTTLPAFYSGVVALCAETMAALGRDRQEVPFAALGDVDERLLCQIDAVVAAGPRALADLVAWWQEGADDPWVAFAGALGAAAFEGGDALGAIARAVAELPEDAEAHAWTIAEALALSDHPDLAVLARDLLRAPHPLGRAVGASFLGARAQLSPAEIQAALGDPAAAVVRAAVWACERLPAPARAALVPALRARAAGADPAVAFSAARALVLSGDREVRSALSRGALDDALGPFTLDLLALCGAASDLPRVEAQLARYPLTPPRVAAAARFGSPAIAARLVRCLADDALAEAAAAGLAVIFGDIVPPARALDAGAWRAALGELTLDLRLRYRRGRPWAPGVVVDECEGGGLPRPEVERRIDELRARLGLAEAVDVTGWWPSARGAAGAFFALARARGGDGREGSG